MGNFYIHLSRYTSIFAQKRVANRVKIAPGAKNKKCPGQFLHKDRKSIFSVSSDRPTPIPKITYKEILFTCKVIPCIGIHTEFCLQSIFLLSK